MAHIVEHCKDCLSLLGKEYKEVHEWLDEFAEDLGPAHRDVRHHKKGVEYIKENMGIMESKAAEIHIKKDCHGIIPTIEYVKMSSLFNQKAYNLLNKEFFK